MCKDVIEDFEDGVDKFVLPGLSFSEITLISYQRDAYIRVSDTRRSIAWVRNTQANQLVTEKPEGNRPARGKSENFWPQSEISAKSMMLLSGRLGHNVVKTINFAPDCEDSVKLG